MLLRVPFRLLRVPASLLRSSPLAAALGLAFGFVLLLPSVGRGQAAPLVLEVRGGGSIPVGSFADGERVGEGVTSGASVGLGFALSGSSRRTLTFGFSQHRFGCSEAGCERKGRHVATSLDLGMRINLATTGDVIPWIRLGGLAMLVELDGLDGEEPDLSDRGYGGEAGLGLYMGTFDQVAINPGVRVAAVNTRLPSGDLLRMRYVVLDLGVALSF